MDNIYALRFSDIFKNVNSGQEGAKSNIELRIKSIKAEN